MHFQGQDQIIADMNDTMSNPQRQRNSHEQSKGGFHGGLSPPEAELLELFPINQMTGVMLDLLKKDIVIKFIRLQMIRKMYSGFPDCKPDPESMLYQYLDFMLSKRFQVSKGITICVTFGASELTI